jgi:hypothetical protein
MRCRALHLLGRTTFTRDDLSFLTPVQRLKIAL